MWELPPPWNRGWVANAPITAIDASRSERKDAAVLQQHNRVGGDLPSDQVVCVDVELARGGVRQFGQGEDAPDGLVHDRLIELTVVDRVDDLCVGGAVAAGHLQVHAGSHAVHPVADGTPVGDDGAGESPVTTQDVGEEPAVAGRVDAVDLVVGAHHGGGAGLGDDAFEGRQVDFAQRALVHVGADAHPLGLLVVGREVLHRRTRARCLQRVDVGRAEDAGEVEGLRSSTRSSGRTAGTV